MSTLSTSSSYFDVYQRGPPSPLKLSRFRRPGRDSSTASSPKDARQPPSRGSSGPSSPIISPSSIHLTPSAALAVSAESKHLGQAPVTSLYVESAIPISVMDALVDDICSSPTSPRAGSSRPGRSRERSEHAAPPGPRMGDEDLSQHHHSLRLRLERLASETGHLHAVLQPDFPTTSADKSPTIARSSAQPYSANGDADLGDSVHELAEAVQHQVQRPPPWPRSATSATAIRSIDDIIRAHSGGLRPTRGASAPPTTATAPPSIDAIIRKHAASLQTASPKRLSGTPRDAPATSVRRQPAPGVRGLGVTVAEADESEPRASLESLEDEVLRTLFPPSPSLHHARSLPAVPDRRMRRASSALGSSPSATSLERPSSLCVSPTLRHIDEPTSLALSSFATTRSRTPRDVARYIRSPRLTRLVRIGRGTTVSVADVGAADGHPVVVFLGLGCVRYLVALYDEMAEALGLRLICLDRWGLGRTTAVPDAQRGFLEWAAVVEEVLDVMDVDRFSILAHSAGAPYALATALRAGDRVQGSVHLLAPWVATDDPSDAATAYKWLRLVPSGVLRTAQAAEWRVQGWRLGKPPSLPVEAIGYNHRAPVSSRDAPPRESLDEAEWDGADHLSQTSHGTIDEGWSTPKTQLIQSRPSTTIPSPSAPRTNPIKRLLSRSARRDSTSPTSSRSPSLRSPSPALPASETSATYAPERSPKTSSPAMAGHSVDLGTALLAASHAESLKGGTADLLAILDRTSKPMGFSYGLIERPVLVWSGDRDERIPLSLVKRLERTMPDCRVHAVVGAGHDLMSNADVMVSVLESLRSELCRSL